MYAPLPLLLIHGPRLRRHETEKTVLQAAGEDEGVLAADQTLAYQLYLTDNGKVPRSPARRRYTDRGKRLRCDAL